MTPEQEVRNAEYKADFCVLTTEEMNRDSYLDWLIAYYKYVRYGPDDQEKGGQRPGSKPPI